MRLPIDASTFPFKHKYLDEETPMLSIWFELGKGCVSNPHGQDIFINLTDNQIKNMIECRNKFIYEVLDILADKS